MNRLQHEKSPYLLQHADNPVDWYPWGPEAFEAARRLDRPIFLSIGYSTCHWCHVMARESFASREVAEILNRNFIAIKVDREERPDVDSVYMAACTAMNGSGGWPLTLLLTPEQKPFWAGVYLPREQLLALLSQAAQLWREDREELVAQGDALTGHLQKSQAHGPAASDKELIVRAVAQLSGSFDPQWGGFGRAPKFPCPQQLLFLLRYASLTGDDQARKMAEQTLVHMYRGGLFDHVGGGFARYATDGRWLVPHFEKTLYDNALLSLTCVEAYQQTRRPLYAAIARRTLDYVLRELSAPEGGFCSGQDADSDGEEGKFYLFSQEELAQCLGPDAAAFCRDFGVTAGGNFHGKNILNLMDSTDWETAPERWAKQLETFRDVRLRRTALHRDDKVLTAWNGLMLSALARAGLVLEEPRYWNAALDAHRFLSREMTVPAGRLLSRWCGGEAAHDGKLDDYAFYLWGLLTLYDATLRPELLEDALPIARVLLEQFFDPENGGFYPYAADAEQLITRVKDPADGALPSGNAAAALVLSRLDRLTGESLWREAARLQFRYLAGAARRTPAAYCFSLLAMLEVLWPGAELICAAPEIPGELRAWLRRPSASHLAVLVKTPETAALLSRIAPFTAAYPIPAEGVRYYLCRGGHCEQPTDSWEVLQSWIETT